MTAAVLFDLDGTLTPRRASVERFASLFAEDLTDRLVAPPAAELRALLVEVDRGGYNPRRAEDLIAALEWTAPPEPGFLEDYWQRRFADAVVPQPGLHAVLDAIRAAGWRIGVVTNGGVAGQSRKLERLDLTARLDAVVISEAEGCEKPDPRIFERACERVGAAPGDCWFVGDHPEKDVRGAERCGLEAVWITDPTSGFAWAEGAAEGAAEDVPPPAHRIEDLRALLPLLGLSSTA